MKKVIIITRRDSKPITIEKTERDIQSTNFNIHYYCRMMAKCLLELSPTTLAYMAIDRFYKISGLKRDDRLKPGIKGTFPGVKKCGEVELPMATKSSDLSDFFTEIAKSIPGDKNPYESIVVDEKIEVIQVYMDSVRNGLIGDGNLALATAMRYDLILSVCKDCGVKEDGENILYVHDKEWGVDCRMNGGMEYNVESDVNSLPDDVRDLSKFFKYRN